MQLWSSLLVVVTALSAALGKLAYRKDAPMDIFIKDHPNINAGVIHGDPAFNKIVRMDIHRKDEPTTKAPVVHDPVPPKIETKNVTQGGFSSLNTSLPSKANVLNTTSPPNPDVSLEKLVNNTKILKVNMAKYLRSKFQDTFSSGSNLLDLEVAKKMVAYYTKRLYNLYPDLSAAAVQWLHPSINKRKDDMYKVYGRSRIPDDKTCPHHVNETIACALQISNPVLNKILKRLGY